MLENNLKKNHIRFMPALAIFAVGCFFRYLSVSISSYSSTLFALNYDYGFIPRGLLGTLYNRLYEEYQWEVSNHMAALNISGFFTIVYFIVLLLFFGIALRKVKLNDKANLQHLIVFLSIFAFPMFMTDTNFGHTDLYLFILTILSLILFVSERLEWLIIPLGMLSCCINHEFLITNANLILVLLLYKILSKTGWKRLKYIVIGVGFLTSVLWLYNYFVNFNYEALVPFYEEIKANAKLFSETELTYNTFILNGDIMGLDLVAKEAPYYLYNVLDFPVFCIVFAPYIYFGLRFFIKLITKKEITNSQRLTYIIFFVGGATIIPQFIFGIDYGRYIFHTLFYYIVLIIFGLASHDDTISILLDELKMKLKSLTPMHFIWFLYPVFFIPLRRITISTQIHDLAEVLFTEASFFLLPEILP